MDRDGYRLVHNGRVGMDIELGPQTTLGLVGSGLSNRYAQDATAVSDVSQEQALLTRTDIVLNEVNHWSSMMGNINFRHQFGDHSLSLDVDYLYYANDNPSNYTMEYQRNEAVPILPDEISLEKTTPIHMWIAKADLEFSLGEAAKLETGLKGVRNRMNNDVTLKQLFQDSWVLSQRFSQNFLLEEDLAAAYLNFYTRLDDKTQLQSGLRTEYTRMLIPSDSVGKEAQFDLNFWSLFPTFFLSRKISDQHQVQLSYNRRITRPSYTEIAPFVFFMDPNTYFTGNPELRPTLSNQIQAGYTFGERFIFNLSYSHDRHFIARLQATTEPETNLVYFQSKNLDRLHTWSATASFPLNPTKWWQIQNNLVGSYQRILTKYEGFDMDIRRWIAQVNTVHTFLLPLNMSAELSAFYNSPAQFGIAQFGGTGFVSAALQKSFAEGRSKLSLSISDIFWTNRFIVESNSAELNDHQRWNLLFEPRVVRISFTHNFGSQKVRDKRGRSTGSEEERNRMGI
jgi:outer membrane receptor protein involved in Fe transport